jgi:hypothetical protein
VAFLTLNNCEVLVRRKKLLANRAYLILGSRTAIWDLSYSYRPLNPFWGAQLLIFATLLLTSHASHFKPQLLIVLKDLKNWFLPK